MVLVAINKYTIAILTAIVYSAQLPYLSTLHAWNKLKLNWYTHDTTMLNELKNSKTKYFLPVNDKIHNVEYDLQLNDKIDMEKNDKFRNNFLAIDELISNGSFEFVNINNYYYDYDYDYSYDTIENNIEQLMNLYYWYKQYKAIQNNCLNSESKCLDNIHGYYNADNNISKFDESKFKALYKIITGKVDRKMQENLGENDKVSYAEEIIPLIENLDYYITLYKELYEQYQTIFLTTSPSSYSTNSMKKNKRYKTFKQSGSFNAKANTKFKYSQDLHNTTKPINTRTPTKSIHQNTSIHINDTNISQFTKYRSANNMNNTNIMFHTTYSNVYITTQLFNSFNVDKELSTNKSVTRLQPNFFKTTRIYGFNSKINISNSTIKELLIKKVTKSELSRVATQRRTSFSKNKSKNNTSLTTNINFNVHSTTKQRFITNSSTKRNSKIYSTVKQKVNAYSTTKQIYNAISTLNIKFLNTRYDGITYRITFEHSLKSLIKQLSSFSIQHKSDNNSKKVTRTNKNNDHIRLKTSTSNETMSKMLSKLIIASNSTIHRLSTKRVSNNIKEKTATKSKNKSNTLRQRKESNLTRQTNFLANSIKHQSAVITKEVATISTKFHNYYIKTTKQASNYAKYGQKSLYTTNEVAKPNQTIKTKNTLTYLTTAINKAHFNTKNIFNKTIEYKFTSKSIAKAILSTLQKFTRNQHNYYTAKIQQSFQNTHVQTEHKFSNRNKKEQTQYTTKEITQIAHIINSANRFYNTKPKLDKISTFNNVSRSILEAKLHSNTEVITTSENSSTFKATTIQSKIMRGGNLWQNKNKSLSASTKFVVIRKETSKKLLTTKTNKASGLTDEDIKFVNIKVQNDRRAFSAVIEDKDLSIIGSLLKDNDKMPILKNLAVTLFIPTDEALKKLPMDITAIKQKNILSRRLSYMDKPYLFQNSNLINDITSIKSKVLKDFEAIVMYGTALTLISPSKLIKEESMLVRTEYKNSKICIKYINSTVEPACDHDSKSNVKMSTKFSLSTNNASDTNEIVALDKPYFKIENAKVTEIIKCKSGYIYKLDEVIVPEFNKNAHNLLDYLKYSPEYQKLYLLVKSANLFNEHTVNAGPITIFLIKDDDWKYQNTKIPDCFFKALIRKENKAFLQKLLKWMTVPGYFTYEDLKNYQWLYSLEGPMLLISHINQHKWNDILDKTSQFNYTSNDEIVLTAYIHQLLNSSNNIQEENDTKSRNNTIILVEGKEIIEMNIPLRNGIAHVLSQIPLRPDIDVKAILWDCVDYICNECPITTKFLLKYFDNGGLLPDVRNPKAYIVPPGIRPDWVCNSLSQWFPPGWVPNDWYHYLNLLKRGKEQNKRHHQLEKIAIAGNEKASAKKYRLLTKLAQAEDKLMLFWGLYGNPSNYIGGKFDDLSKLLGRLIYRRELVDLPKICKPKPITHRHKHGHLQNSTGDYYDLDMVNDEEPLRSDYVSLSWNELAWLTQWTN